MKHWIATVLKQKCARMHQILFQFPFSRGNTPGHPPLGALPPNPRGRGRDVTRLGEPKPPLPKDVAAPSNWNGNRSFCTAVLDIMLL